MEDLKLKIAELKKQKNAVIMAHYYVDDSVQEVADYIGDSYYLSELSTHVDAAIIVLCGVEFMGESAKVLNPNKKVLIPASDADCPMAHMATVQKINEIRAQYDDVAVVCYVNSTAEIKAASDVCVTSTNALKIVKALPNKNILFIPDRNLARFIADQLPEKHFIYNDGYCPVHDSVTATDIEAAKKLHPEALVLMHPECKPEATALADFVGSTSGIIKYATQSPAKQFIIVTEIGIMHELKKSNPCKKFFTLEHKQVCYDMKKISLEKIVQALETEQPEIELEDSLADSALKPLQRMLELSR